MAYEEKNYEHDNDFDWALREKDQKQIHITELSAEDKGKKGYRCLGTNCGNQLIAVPIRKNTKYKPYFRHAPVNIKKGEKGCTFSNREYREALASSILTRLKKIKVPPIYKVNPQNCDEYKLIEESKYINASSVKSQVTFFEDKEGNIHWGKHPEIKNKFLIRRPDVVFFNKNGYPILLIELVITHKLDDDKIADLYRLGIDTIQVIVPRTSEEEIEKNFHSIKNTKWVYNEKEATANYIHIFGGNNQRILEPNELQNRLFKESYRCRIFRIRDLIRAIGKCLESEQYGNIEYHLNSEISRVERNTESAQQRLGALEEQNSTEAYSRNRSIEDEIRKNQDEFQQNFESEEKELRGEIERAEDRLGEMEESNRRAAHDRNRGEEEEVDSEQRDLERRYLIKDRSIEQGFEENYRSQNIGISIKRKIEGEERIVRRHREEKEKITTRIEREGNDIENEFGSKIVFEEAEINRLEEEERNLDQKVRAEINFKIDIEERDIYDLRKQQERVKVEIREEFRGENEFEDSEIERLEGEENDLERDVREEFLREIKDSSSKLPRAIKTILDAERVGDTYTKTERKEASCQRARELFNKGTWEER